MVGKEQECCGFLGFELAETDDDVRLTITAPERARDVADALRAVRTSRCGGDERGQRESGHSADGHFATNLRRGNRSGTNGIGCCSDNSDVRRCLRLLLRAPVRLSGGRCGRHGYSPGVVRWSAQLGNRLGGCHCRGRLDLDRLPELPSTAKPSRATLYMMPLATAVLIVAVFWPRIEPHLIRAVTQG
jgi:hypothetical protein